MSSFFSKRGELFGDGFRQREIHELHQWIRQLQNRRVIENVGGKMVDRKVGDLVSEEGVELRDFLKISDMKVQMYWTS